ncbi:MAG: Uma2 family endonuclease [Planctomycetota bacterium]
MNWSDVLADPCLQDLPYKIELNQHGAIVMTPASNRHARQQSRIYDLLNSLKRSGELIVECAVGTESGVRVPDVAWMSDSFVAKHGESTPFPRAPELCVEVVSPSNSRAEMEEKIQLYLDRSAREVWLCSEAGTVEFFDATGAVDESQLFAGFPTQIK